MRRVEGRDTLAFERLYDDYHRLVFGIALRMLHDSPAAEDLTQTVFFKLWLRPEAFRGGSFVAWLATITRNRGRDLLRSRAAHPEQAIAGDLPVEDAFEEVVCAAADAGTVRAALALLPAALREPIELGFFGGITYEQIALDSATPVGTVKTRIRTGLRRLRDELRGQTSR